MSKDGRTLFGSVPPITLNLIIITVICWLAQFLFQDKGIYLSQLFGLHYFKSEAFYPHQIISYMFMHDTSSIMHVFFNMFAVFMFGRTLETVWGPKRFLFYYVATAIGAALTSLLVAYLRINSAESGMTPEMISEVYKNGLGILNTGKNYADPLLGELNLLLNQCTVGASGAVFGILLAFGMIFPDTKLVIIPIPVPIKAKYLVIFYGLGELLLGIWDRPGDNVAHFAHFGGLFFGLIIMLYWRKKNKEHGRFY